MPSIKELKTKIRSVQSTRKITRAMQMVSAAKMRKSQMAVLSSRTYSSLAWELITNLTGSANGVIQSAAEGSQKRDYSDAFRMAPLEKPGIDHLLKSYPNAKKIGIILLGTNRGFVGSLNTNLIAQFKNIEDTEVISEVVVYGRKAKDLARIFHKNMVADFEKQDRTITTQDIFPLAKYITDAYVTGQYKKIVIVYNHFVSTLTQKPSVKQLLPFGETSANWTEDRGQKKEQSTSLPTTHYQLPTKSDYLFEPSPELVLNHLVPRIIESQIYQAILESDASEHSARMVMMKNATEAAGDLIADYTLTYNQLRQNKITTELAEITAGKIALE